MKKINYSDFRNNLSSMLDEVNENHTPILVTRQKSKPAIVISLADYNSYKETIYLMSSSVNRKRLNKSIKDIEEGKVIEKKIEE